MTEQRTIADIAELPDPFARMVVIAFGGKVVDESSRTQFEEDARQIFPGLELSESALTFGGYSAQTHILRGLTQSDPSSCIELTHSLVRASGRTSHDYSQAKQLRSLRLVERGIWTADDISKSRRILSNFAGRILTRAGGDQL
jgi:hypothetical protein